MGFKGSVIHGLWSYNATAYAVLRSMGGSNISNLKHFEAKFASPIYAGENCIIDMWQLGEYDGEGFEEIRFIVRVVGGKPALTNGRALVRPQRSSSKI